MPNARHNYAIATLNGYIFIAGGDVRTDMIPYDKSTYFVDRYDPIENKWMKVTRMNHRRHYFDLIEYHGFLYAIGGNADRTYRIERYNFEKNFWVRSLFLRKISFEF